MSHHDKDAVRRMLEAHNTMTLATCDAGRPWAASLFFASDASLNLYFVSDYRTRHAREIEGLGTVAATVNADCGRWADVRGLQIEGHCGVLDGTARIAALGHYLAKFHDVKALFEAPRDDDERTIAQRLKAANMYRLRPRRIRLIDNSRWFGYKTEFELPDESA